MRTTLKKIMSAALIAILITAVLPVGAFASGYQTKYYFPDCLVLADDKGMSVNDEGEYFIDAKDLKPGDTIHSTLTFMNLSQDDKWFELYIQTEPISKQGPVNLFEGVELTINLVEGFWPFKGCYFKGNIAGDGVSRYSETWNDKVDMTDPQGVMLGRYPAQTYGVYQVELHVDPEMKVYNEKSEAIFKWRFIANEYVPPEPPDYEGSDKPDGTPEHDIVSKNPEGMGEPFWEAPPPDQLIEMGDGKRGNTPQTGAQRRNTLLAAVILLGGILFFVKAVQKEDPQKEKEPPN